MDKIRIFIRNLIAGVKNLIVWFPVIWKDRSWDDYFFFELLRFKLNNMEKFFRAKGIHLNTNRDADNIKKCILLLDRILEDEYNEIAYKKHDEKWGEVQMSTGKTDERGLTKLNIFRPNVTPETKERERKEYRKCYEHEGYLRVQDIDYLFATIQKHIQEWWD